MGPRVPAGKLWVLLVEKARQVPQLSVSLRHIRATPLLSVAAMSTLTVRP